MIVNVLLVALGGAFGALTRHSISVWLEKYRVGSFPHATLIINIMGAYAFGFIIGYEVKTLILLLLGVGFLGAFSTFSTLNYELLQLAKEKNWVFFCNYFVLTYLFGIAIAFAGFMSASLLKELGSHFQFVQFML